MCGISGYISTKRIDKDTLKSMNDTMYHRGPDDEGVELYDAPNGYIVGMAQRRLSIQDLSELGHQPMSSFDGRVSIVYNGEIYNFPELKEELSQAGFSFKSNCDTEGIIYAYLYWGAACVEHFNGMFAIALYDRKEEKVYFWRDRIGKKPLYYEVVKGDDSTEIFFGSELKPIMARPDFKGEINTKVLGRYLFHQYINAPETVFKNVYKLEPGAELKFDLNNSNNPIEIRKYWDINEVYHKMRQNPVTDYEEAKTTLKELLRSSVRRRMLSDVPLGTFLSGGYDSSLMCAIAQEVSDGPIKTFSIGFNEEKYNEAVYAKKVAEYLGTDHTETYISEDDMFDMVDSIPKFYDEPFADSSQVCTMLVSKLAKSKVTVALSGDGGDEFFCGYNVYELVRKAQKLDALGAVAGGLCNLPGLRQANVIDRLPFKVRTIAANRDRNTKTQFGNENFYIKTASKMLLDKEQLSVTYPIELRYGVSNWQIRRMLLDMDTYLPGDILCKVDRASMKYSLESRCPILDKDVMEYSFRLDHSFKYKDGNKKRILKDIAYDYIPKELLERPKVGFAVPLDKWLRGPLKERLLDVTNENYLKNQGIFDSKYTSQMIENYLSTGDAGPSTGANYSKMAWSLLVFQMWYETYMKYL